LSSHRPSLPLRLFSIKIFFSNSSRLLGVWTHSRTSPGYPCAFFSGFGHLEVSLALRRVSAQQFSTAMLRSPLPLSSISPRKFTYTSVNSRLRPSPRLLFNRRGRPRSPFLSKLIF
jgi:hypothetical protein